MTIMILNIGEKVTTTTDISKFRKEDDEFEVRVIIVRFFKYQELFYSEKYIIHVEIKCYIKV